MKTKTFLYATCLALTLRSTTCLLVAVPVAVQIASGKHGMVVAGHPEAAAAGVRMLLAGGNAVDAAVATSLAATVAEPYGSSLGGKHVMVYFEAKTKKVYVVSGMDAVSNSIDVADFVEKRNRARRNRQPGQGGAVTANTGEDQFGSGTSGYGIVGIPGLPAALWTAHEKWGKLPWAQDVQPAIEMAHDGITVLPKTRDVFEESEKLLRAGDKEIARIYLPNGQLPLIGSRLKNLDLAHSLQIFAQQGFDGFYRGPIAAMIVSATQKNGGTLTMEDFANYIVAVEEPVSVTYQGYTLYGPGRPTTGWARMFPTLAVLDGLKLEPAKLRTADNLALLNRVWKQVGALAGKGDAGQLLNPETISGIRGKVALGVDTPPLPSSVQEQPDSPMASTATLTTMDEEGNVCSMTQSDSSHFGAGVVPPGTGIIMSNSNGNFNTQDPENWNYIGPGKRAASTIAPTLVVRDGQPVFSIGLPGGGRIPGGIMQVIVDHIAFGRSFEEAIGDTRFDFTGGAIGAGGTSQQSSSGIGGIAAESTLDPHIVDELKAKGLTVSLSRAGFGGVNVIERSPDGTMTGYADTRRANAASGY